MFKKLIVSTELKKARKELKLVNDLEPEISKLTNPQLQAKTNEFKQRLQKGETLSDIRIEAFAVAREATKRILEKRPFDVQVLGGLILDYGSVAEMRTGEGKTITSILPVYLNALSGKGVIVSTVNEYLTQRDAEEMGEVHNFLGMTVGINLRELGTTQKREAYQKDITYSVHSEIGFDYLRDNMVQTIEEKVQRGFNFALIDEVDSILIDEAKTPLIISGGSSTPSEFYFQTDTFVKKLKKEDYDIDWESKGIQLTEQGIDKANKFFKTSNIFQVQNSELVNRLQNALRANYIMKKDADYIVVENEIQLVDAFTGRVMEGRAYSDGLQQAIQAKEKVEVEPETKTLATVTYQNLFRMFSKLCGMSGTAKTEEDEFIEIYNMRVHAIPTNKPIKRMDKNDIVFASAEAKYKAIVKEIKKRHKLGQPILVGTEEVGESERIHKLLKKEKIKCTVLNAKQNSSEAEIISQAGKEKAITIATNMAGRGTDIKPTEESLRLGGLFVLGTNKAESRRIDNQLKGRSGRQGNPGESRFFISLDDSLISRFSNQPKLKKAFSSFGDKPIKGKLIVKTLKRAQIKIEGFNFDSRKNVLQYDDVIRQQRDLIYAQRDIIISQDDLIFVINRMMSSVVKEAILEFDSFKQQDGTINVNKVVDVLNSIWFSTSEDKLKLEEIAGRSNEEITDIIEKKVLNTYAELRKIAIENTDEQFLKYHERKIVLNTFDKNWQLHIDQMTKLRSSSSLASYAQKNPYQVYVEKGSELFEELLKRIAHNSIRSIMSNRLTVKMEEAKIVEPEAKIEEKDSVKKEKKLTNAKGNTSDKNKKQEK